uniref:Uncharacterized protein n=1 Tax=Prevotella sp. GTC17262 TaxID=3236797 RepID=A0AB33JK97_9BACT
MYAGYPKYRNKKVIANEKKEFKDTNNELFLTFDVACMTIVIIIVTIPAILPTIPIRQNISE